MFWSVDVCMWGGGRGAGRGMGVEWQGELRQIFLMEIDLYLIKLENKEKEKRITWDYIIQYNTKNVKITSLLKIYKQYLENMYSSLTSF